MEISEVQAQDIIRQTGIPPINPDGFEGWQLSSLNEQVEEFLHQHYFEQRIPPSAALKRFEQIATRTTRLLEALPKIEILESAADGTLEDFSIDAMLSTGKDGCGNLQPLVERLEALRHAADKAAYWMRHRVEEDDAIPRHQGEPAFNEFLKQLLRSYEGIFGDVARLSRKSPDANGEGGDPGGPVLRFVEAVLSTIGENIDSNVKTSDPTVLKLLASHGEPLFARLRRAINDDRKELEGWVETFLPSINGRDSPDGESAE